MDLPNGTPVNETNAEGQPEEREVFSILIKKDGSLKIVTPLLGDEAACYGVLEVAKRIVAREHTKAENRIVPAPRGIINFIRNRKNGG